jgi:3-oxoacyl-[acyl-carrier protein] reductase
MNALDFKGRTAIVTGGAQGIGQAIVKRLAASGAAVRIWDQDAKLLQQCVTALGGKVSGDAVDVTDPAAVEKAAKSVAATLGKIDVLVNNAGVAGMNTPTVDYPVEEWERVLRVNLTSQFLCCKFVAPYMVANKYGRVVNIASIAGKEGNPNAVAYSASMAGVISLTKSLGKELAQAGVLNASSIGCIATRTACTRTMRGRRGAGMRQSARPSRSSTPASSFAQRRLWARWISTAVCASPRRMASTTAAWLTFEYTGFARTATVISRKRCALSRKLRATATSCWLSQSSTSRQ